MRNKNFVLPISSEVMAVAGFLGGAASLLIFLVQGISANLAAVLFLSVVFLISAVVLYIVREALLEQKQEYLEEANWLQRRELERQTALRAEALARAEIAEAKLAAYVADENWPMKTEG